MNRITIAALLISTFWCGHALAWSHANRYGGSTEHAYGEGTEHTSAWGTSTAHAWGGGTEHTNVYGGTTAGKYGEGAYHAGPYGATAYHPPAYGGAYYHPPAYYPYHPPVAVPYYSSGCYGCAAAAGAVVGMAAGAAIASSEHCCGYVQRVFRRSRRRQREHGQCLQRRCRDRVRRRRQHQLHDGR